MVAELNPEITITYRLSWELPSVDQCSQLEKKYGRSIWQKLPESDWEKLAWKIITRESTDLADIADQRAQLELWAATKDQPVRNIVFERRAMHASQWEPVL